MCFRVLSFEQTTMGISISLTDVSESFPLFLLAIIVAFIHFFHGSLPFSLFPAVMGKSPLDLYLVTIIYDMILVLST